MRIAAPKALATAVQDPLEEHVKHLYHFALRLTCDPHTAEDIAQEAILRAWQSRARLRRPESLRVWLFRIATNLWRDRLRRGRHPAARPASLPVDDDGGAQVAPGVEQRLADREEIERVLSLIDGFPDRQRQVLWLHAFEGFSHAEIGRVLGLRPNAVKVNLHHARRTLRRRLAEPSSAD